MSRSRAFSIAALAIVLSCKKSVGDVRTVDVVADGSGTPANPTNVSLTLAAGELHVTPGGAHTVSGSARSNVKNLDPKTEAAPDHVKITQGDSDADATVYGSELIADWRLTLGPTPIALSVDAGAAKVQLELGGLALKNVHVKSAAGTIDLGFLQPNPLAADDIDIETGSGAITLTGVGAFGASKVHVHAGMGTITVDMGSRIERETELDVEASAGTITIKMPATITARAVTSQAAGQVTATGWTKDESSKAVDGERAFVLGGAGSSRRVSIRAKSGAGTIALIATP